MPDRTRDRQLKNVVISSHVLLYGASHALRDYLLKKNTNTLLFISLPFFTQRNFIVNNYKNGVVKNEEVTPARLPTSLNYFFEIYFILSRTRKVHGDIDLFVGVDPLNCIAGLILRKIGKVKRVIFYSIDFVPRRFGNNILNNLFHWIEAYCVKNADEVWNVSPRIAQGREKFLHLSEKKYSQKVVPIGVWRIRYKKQEKENVFTLLFIGHLLEKQGLQKVIEAVSVVVTTHKIKLLIVGGGEYEKKLKKQVKLLKLEQFIEFTGWIHDRKKLEEYMEESSLAVACYKPEKDKMYNFTYYADPTKIKDYLSMGLPVIMTDVPFNAKELEEKGCGIVVKYNKQDIADGIKKFIKDKNLRSRYSENARKYMKNFTWDEIFKRAL